MLASTSSGSSSAVSRSALISAWRNSALSSKVTLASRGKQLVVLGRDERIDLDQRGIGIDECLIQALQESNSLIDLRRFESKRKSELARLPCAEANRRIDRLFKDGIGILAATSSISMPPACEAIKTSLPVARSSTIPR